MNEIPLQGSIARSSASDARAWFIATALGLPVLCFGIGWGAYQLGANQTRLASLPEAIVHATATHGGENVSVATGQIGDESEGIFILDHLTGNLQCWVYNARFRQFGAKYETNIMREFPAKGAEYLLVTGAVSPQQATSNNARPAGCVVYVVDPRSGMFAGYTFPWNRQAELQGQPQGGPMFCVGGDLYRAPSGGGAAKKPEATTPENSKEKSKKATPK